MKLTLTIEIELEERDMPLYGRRLNHALAGLLTKALEKDLRGEYEFEYPSDDYYRIPPSITKVRVTKD